eukprot:TRINITY_DN9492_c0_g1_i1.p1 TRINITY_DN9492_c0_g1~~TRINITY_DN9492_c0_g1_i1.p1  ORF type:complete len:371 (-),score=51.31 TRINITY_DN9492_c0_g1_i1:44-1156(-)
MWTRNGAQWLSAAGSALWGEHHDAVVVHSYHTGRNLLTSEDYCDLVDLNQDEQVEYAESLDDLNEFSIALGVVLWVAAMLAIVPQHVKIWQTKSSEGLSYLMLFLSNINQFSSVVNATVLKFPQIRACFEADILTCTPSLLTLYQLIGAWVANFPVFWWYLLFFWRTESVVADPKKARFEWRMALFLFYFFLGYICVMIVLSTIFLMVFGECDDITTWFGWAVGMGSIVTVFIQWTPQIWKTWRLKAVGSFSIITLLIQAPGTMVIVYFLVFLSHESLSTWLSYFAAGLQQFVLLGLLIYFWWRNRGTDREGLGNSGGLAAESDRISGSKHHSYTSSERGHNKIVADDSEGILNSDSTSDITDTDSDRFA